MPRISSRRQQANIKIAQKWNHSWPPTWQVFTPFVMRTPTQANGAQYFLGYDTSSGHIVIAQMTNNNGVLRVSFAKISPQGVLPQGLNNLQAFIGLPYLIYYKDGDSSATFAQVVPGDTTNSLTIQSWPTVHLPANGTLVPIMYQNQPWVMAYEGSKLGLYQIDLDNKIATLRNTQDWGSGWTAFAPIATGDYFVCLNAATRALRAGQIDLGGAEPVVISSDLPDPLPQAWDALSSLVGTVGPSFLAYAQNSTIAPQIYTLQWGSPLVITAHTSDDWPLDATSITAFSFSATGHEFYLISQQMNTAPHAISSVLVTISSGVKPGYPGT